MPRKSIDLSDDLWEILLELDSVALWDIVRCLLMCREDEKEPDFDGDSSQLVLYLLTRYATHLEHRVQRLEELLQEMEAVHGGTIEG